MNHIQKAKDFLKEKFIRFLKPDEMIRVKKFAELLGYIPFTCDTDYSKFTSITFYSDYEMCAGDNKEDWAGFTELTMDELPFIPAYDYVRPDHYKQSDGTETIDRMIAEFGAEKVAIFCEINAFKYADRMGKKPGEDEARERAKMEWYNNKANELYSQLNATRREK